MKGKPCLSSQIDRMKVVKLMSGWTVIVSLKFRIFDRPASLTSPVAFRDGKP